ncbi:Pre-mRNA-processing-splicing factor 8A [Sarracenia purpurea var. burkii]
MTEEAFSNTKDGIWNLPNEQTKEDTAVALLRVDDKHIKVFENSALTGKSLCLQVPQHSQKIGNKWISALTGIMTYFREAIVHTQKTVRFASEV